MNWEGVSLRLFGLIFHLLLAVVTSGWSQEASRVEVSMDCREGIGLIPSVWRGGATTDGVLPVGLELKTVRLGPNIVRTVWATKLAGGDYSWSDLDSRLDTLASAGINVILAVPVPGGEALVDLWPELVYDLASRTYKKVGRFEIFQGEEVTGNARYLEFYESAVWAIYRANARARIGGPGTMWPGETLSELISHCTELDLPLHFVSWGVRLNQISDLTDSMADARELLRENRLSSRPGLVISRWQAMPLDGSDPDGLTLSALREIVDMDLDAACMNFSGSDETAVRMFARMGRVRVELTVDPNTHGLRGMGSLAGEGAMALMWGTRDSVQVDMSFVGIAWGREIRIRRFGTVSSAPLENVVIPMADPARASFILRKDEVSLVWLQVVE